MRSLILIVVCCGWMSALDLTVNSDFATNEDTPLVFSYAELLAKCTVGGGTATGFKVITISGNGTALVGASATGPWSALVLNTLNFQAGQFIQYTPTENLNGDNRLMMSIKATNGSANSPECTVSVDIAPVNDVITAASGTFTQPMSPQVTEDTTYTFTWQQVQDTLAITEPDAQTWSATIVSRSSGRLWSADGLTEFTTFPVVLPADSAGNPAFRWQPDANAFTKNGEAAIAVCTMQAVNTVAPLDHSTTVTFSTPVVGVADPLTGQPTTMTGLDHIVLHKGTINIFTYDQLHALIQGSNDVDRVGSLRLWLNHGAIDGCTIEQYSLGILFTTDTTPLSLPATVGVGGSIHILVPDGLRTGDLSAGTADLHVTSSTGTSSPGVPITFEVHGGGGGGTGGGSGSSASGGGGGGCGLGAGILCCLALFAMILNLQRSVRR